MKKHLLLGIAVVAGVVAFGQNSSTVHTSITPQKINPIAAKVALPIQKFNQLGGPNTFESVVYGAQQFQNRPKVWGPAVRIGGTGYQLQTNSSICNRIVRPTDSTISATWTMSQLLVTPWADRGTGYNYFNGSAWSLGSGSGGGPTARIESVRCGFTNIGYTNTGEEIIVSHEAPSGGGLGYLHVDQRPAVGTGTWTESALGFSDVWARMAVGGANGHTIHVISSSGLGGGTALITYHGQTGAIDYSRSLDGGNTWDLQRTIIPCLDSSHYLGFGGDSYSIDAKGDTIAIVAGGFDVDVVLAKSYDNGNTWTSTVVKRFPIPMYNGATMVTDTTNPVGGTNIDTLESNDASVEVLLDNNGMAHVWYGRMRVSEAAGGTAMSYFPATDGLMYWNESMGTSQPVMIAAVKDLSYPGHPLDSVINIDFCNTAGCTLLGFGTYQVSLTSFPSAGTDPQGRLYLAYGSIYEGVTEQGNEIPTHNTGANPPSVSYRHTYLMRSDDNGATWCTPIDLSDPETTYTGTYDYIEGVYGAVAKHNNGFVHLINQQDNSPGHGVAGSGTNPDTQTNAADILYYKIPVDDLACNTGVNDKYKNDNSISLYPNPATNSVNLKFNVTKNTKALVKVYNVMGQQVASFDNQSITNGSILTIDVAKYTKGIYFVNSVIDGKTFSHKLIVE